METKLNGWDSVTRVTTIDSMYADDKLRVYVGDKEYRITTQEIEQMMNYFKFDVAMARKYGYLQNPILVEDTH